MNYIDLFAGAGGLSEGFVRSGYSPIAHVEMDKAACETLRTRAAYHYLKSKNRLDQYYAYVSGKIDNESLHRGIPKRELESNYSEATHYMDDFMFWKDVITMDDANRMV